MQAVEELYKIDIQTPVDPTAVTLGADIDAFLALKQKKRELEKQAKDLGSEIEAQERKLIERMDTQGISRAGAVTISESVYPSVENWDEYWAYIVRNKYYHLVERRPSAPGCRELFEMGVTIPGVQPFTKRRLK